MVGEFFRLLSGIGSTKDLTAPEHQAACLLGRGATPEQIEDLTGVTQGRLALLGENPVFLDKVSRQRVAWANEEIARLQQSISGLVPVSVNQAVQLWRVISDVLDKRHALDKARVELAIKVQESRERLAAAPDDKPALPDIRVEIEDVELEDEAEEAVGEWEAWEGNAGREVDEEEVEPALP